MRILILDDYPDLSAALVAHLRANGFSAIAFTCPHEALQSIHEADILVTDYHMREMTGLEVARQAYAQGWRGSLLLMSGRTSAITEGIAHPLLRFVLEKPFGPGELMEKLQSLD